MGTFSIKEVFSDLPLDITKDHIKVGFKQETNIKGIYAAGDITGEPYQISKALFDGMNAGINLPDYIKNKN